jgi:sugar phosphate isomerase/epimerase
MAGLSVNEITTYRWTFDEDVARYRAAGIEAIGVWRQKLADYGEERGIALLRDSGLNVSNLLWAGGFTGSDGHSYEESIDDACDAIRLAGELKADCLVVYSGGRNGHTQNHARRLFATALRELLPACEHHDVVLAVEPMHPGCAGEWTILTGLDEALALVDGIGHPRIKLAFDTYHWGRRHSRASTSSGTAHRRGSLGRRYGAARSRAKPLLPGRRNAPLVGHGALSRSGRLPRPLRRRTDGRGG